MNIIQIGCHDGNDKVFNFIDSRRDEICAAYLIEPNIEMLALARNRYAELPFVTFHNLAIVTDTESLFVEIYLPLDASQSQTTSLFRDHAQQFQTTTVSREVPCSTLSQFMSSNSIDNLDYLFIDAEGLDCKILDGLDLKKYNIKYIEYEFVHSDGTHRFGDLGRATENRLRSLGYVITQSPPFNKIAQKL